MSTSFSVNGRRVTVDADPNLPLLWALRDVLELHGTRFSCGVGACHACTVLVDGSPAPSCIIPVSAVVDRNVETVESDPDSVKAALHAAWEAEGVPQCGFCQSGQLIAACALLRTTKQPTDTQIDAALDEHLCRCGTYARIRRGVHVAARSLQASAR